jgi:hypothetical protein
MILISKEEKHVLVKFIMGNKNKGYNELFQKE